MNVLIGKLKALGDSNRFRICMMLLHQPLCVCQMLKVLDIAGGTLSNHLKILKTNGLVNIRKEGKWSEYYVPLESKEFLNRIRNDLVDFNQEEEDLRIVGQTNKFECSTSHKKT